MSIFTDHQSKNITGKQVNEYNNKYYKIINNEQWNHFNKCQDKEQIFHSDQFDNKYRFGVNDICFTTIDHIFENLHEGSSMCEIIIPDDAKCNVMRNRIGSDTVMIGELILIKNMDEWNDADFCLNAVKQNGDTLKFVKEQTEEICEEAVEQSAHALLYVNEITCDLCDHIQCLMNK
jgi:hypothetical protein